MTDVDRPIGVVSDGLDANDSAMLAEAAECWNLEFGTHFVTGDDARRVPQQVQAFYDQATCLLQTMAQVQDGTPARLAVCPEKYWDAFRGPYAGQVTPFRVLSHELGHVLNIIGHPDDSFAVMRGAASKGSI